MLERHGAPVRTVLQRSYHRRLKGEVDLDDVMQVTYLEAFLRVEAFTPGGPGSFGAWLRRIAENNLRDAIRKSDAADQPRSPAAMAGADSCRGLHAAPDRQRRRRGAGAGAAGRGGGALRSGGERSAVGAPRGVAAREHWIRHGQSLVALARFEQAQEQLVEAQEVFLAALGPAHLYTGMLNAAFADLHDAWHAAEPGTGHDVKAAEWRALAAPEGAPEQGEAPVPPEL